MQQVILSPNGHIGHLAGRRDGRRDSVLWPVLRRFATLSTHGGVTVPNRTVACAQPLAVAFGEAASDKIRVGDTFDPKAAAGGRA
jgi:hypothetical protein